MEPSLSGSRTNRARSHRAINYRGHKLIQRPNGARAVHKTEYVIDRIVNHNSNEESDHPSESVGDIVYRSRWFRYGPSADIWEPIAHLSRNKVVIYFTKKKLALLNNLGDAQLG